MTEPAAARFPRRPLIAMMLGAILNPINSSIIAVALVPIGNAFDAPASQTAWLVSALYLATSIGQPLVGKFVDLYGAKRLFLAGAALTGIAGLVGTFAPNFWVLVAARVILGFGTCAGYPAAMSLIRKVADRTGLTSPAGVLTLLSVTVQTIAVIGPTLGGILIDFGGWRATMAVNLPLSLAALILGWRFVPSYDDEEPNHARPWLDWAGVALFAVVLVGLLLFLMDPQPRQWWKAAIAIASGALFTRRELRIQRPFIDIRVLSGNVPLLLTYARGLTSATTSYLFIYGFTQWLEQGRGVSPTLAGLILLPTFAVGIVISSLFGRHPQIRAKLIVGGAFQTLVGVVLLFTANESPLWFLFVTTALLGIPQGLLSLSNQNALYRQAEPAALGASSGLLRTFQYLGAIIASAASGLAFGHAATTTGLHALAMFMIVVSALALTITLADRSLSRGL
ncbi:MAG: MFS transporter [Bifidobacterium tibiigranuli]|jgi:MFS family permease|uniref:MFS transporter n=1 Tax=Bifidobacterium tibiigranuli TaxID=2172043 RepID=UPI0026EE53CF|nr:MFS transporter [Bifidobacterium tibiigranuli]MCI1672680.1 MFS transporter [Bifidobacterium tibiigranuli]MCI1712315.1 MFS transporter [Bifidobacterium tibiigranuli]